MSLRPQDFESCASANSATAAINKKILSLFASLSICEFFVIL